MMWRRGGRGGGEGEGGDELAVLDQDEREHHSGFCVALELLVEALMCCQDETGVTELLSQIASSNDPCPEEPATPEVPVRLLTYSCHPPPPPLLLTTSTCL